MSFAEFSRKYQGMAADEIIESLESQYKDDTDAIEQIERTKQNIAYIRKQKNYKGQTPEQCALTLAGNLLQWN